MLAIRQNYILAASFGTSVGIPLGDGRVFPLDRDALFELSVNNPSAINLSNTTGTLDGNGRVQFGTSAIPWVSPIPWGASGVTFYTAYVTIDPTLTGIGSITGISRALPVPVQ